jgi:hypothetical protein
MWIFSLWITPEHIKQAYIEAARRRFQTGETIAANPLGLRSSGI